MVLILTNSRDATVDYLQPILARQGRLAVRLDTDRLAAVSGFHYESSAEPEITVDGQRIVPSGISHVWYRRPERLRLVEGRLRQSPEEEYALDEWSEALEAFLAEIPPARWMNHPAVNAMAASKPMQLRIAESLGLCVPDTIVTQDPAAARLFCERHHHRVVVKPMASGSVEHGDRESLIYANRLTSADEASLDDVAACPTLLQQEIAKGYDIRVTVVDDRVAAFELRLPADQNRRSCDVRRDNMAEVRYSPAALPFDVTAKIRQLTKHFGLRFAAIDLVVSPDGVPFFLEVNANGQWAWLDLVAGASIWQLFVEAFGAGRTCAS